MSQFIGGSPFVASGRVLVRWIAAAAVLQCAVLAGGVVSHAAPLWFGETVRLKVIPVDPRDLFRGDYVVLGYDFSQLDHAAIRGLPQRTSYYDWTEEGREIYLALKPADNGKYLQLREATLTKPAQGPFLTGRINSWRGVSCGIEAWYVQQGEGLKLEADIRSGRNVYADVAVWRGTARLKNLVVE